MIYVVSFCVGLCPHYHEVCPICPSKVMLQNRRQVHLHLNSSEHKERESQVMGDLDSVTTISAATKATRA